MAAYAGSSLYVEWINSSGTTALTGDFRQFSITPSVDLYDQTAGSDAYKTRIVGVKDGAMSFSAVMQAGGTALTNVLASGTEGTLIVAPEGTATGKQKITLPAISMGVKYTIPYNNVVDLAVDFTQNGTRSDTVY
jgi:hypothetical protein